METSKLKKFAQYARRSLIEQVSSKLKHVLAENSEARREKAEAVKQLEAQINRHGREQVIEKIAYTWFNRFCAMRYMDVKRYTRIGMVSPDEGQFQPEILAEAKMGHIDEELVSEKNQKLVFDLLSGKEKSRDPQGEAYRLLVVGACNYWHRAMPFLFERIDDYTELLMPDDLLSGNSILAYTREAMTPSACKDVEVVGWLYQFYISEKKDEVFAALKKGKKIDPENIPAATQLFTPNWIVRYLVENSLGRLWMLNRPESRLKEQMDYYIEPEQAETDFLKVTSPEELKICDPACGSGHMLVYAFDLLFAIYEEEGYDTPEIPRLILENNLYGIEIDERAGALSAFALAMKARERYSRFFFKPVQPQICVLENVAFDEGELKPYIDEVGRDLFTLGFRKTLHQFEEAKNFGSLIRPTLNDVAYIRRVLEEKNVGGNVFLHGVHEKVMRVLWQAEFLGTKYHVVVANPPYMGGKGMNGRLAKWAKDYYPNSKSDLFAMFIENSFELLISCGYSALVTMQSWMFLSSFERFRTILLDQYKIECMVHMANMVMGIAFGTSGTVWKKLSDSDAKGSFCYVSYNDIRENGRPFSFPPNNPQNKAAYPNGFFHVSSNDIKGIPGSPIAYWISERITEMLHTSKRLGDIAEARMGLATGNNLKYVRLWHECSFGKIGFGYQNRESAKESGLRWFPYCKGGAFRRWYGNNEHVVDWYNDGDELRTTLHPSGKRIWAHNFNLDYIFQDSITWSDITSGILSVRFNPPGFLFDGAGTCAFFRSEEEKLASLGLLNTQFLKEFSKVLNPTLHFQTGDFRNIPFKKDIVCPEFLIIVQKLVDKSNEDWDLFETSWNFSQFPLIDADYFKQNLKAAYLSLRTHWQEMTKEMHGLEQQINQIFLNIYELQDELSSDVPLSEITLTCNPHYRYNGDKTEEELEALLLADTMREFISYAVGCMFGRYSLDKPGLILANQGETIEDYIKQAPDSTFPADEDNVIPLLDGDWFPDDITERFCKFLRMTFGDDHYEENLAFIENAIGKDIRKFFLKDFYNDHIKRYKKRPIYWMFSSPKGSFNALIYMHRYRPDTVSVVLNDYLRDFKTKLTAAMEHQQQVGISASAGAREKTQAVKEMERLKSILDELDQWEREVLYPLATRRIEIDLDDGVKVNYVKFGKALKKVPGLS